MLFSFKRAAVSSVAATAALPPLALPRSGSDADALVIAWRQWTPTAALGSRVRGVSAWVSAIVSAGALVGMIAPVWMRPGSFVWLQVTAPVVLVISVVVFLFTLPPTAMGKVYGWAVVANEVSFWVFVVGSGVLTVAALTTIAHGVEERWSGDLADAALALSASTVLLTALSVLVPPPLFGRRWRPRIWAASVASAVPVWTSLGAVVGLTLVLPSDADNTGAVVWTGGAVALGVGLLTFVFTSVTSRAKRIGTYRTAFTEYLAALDLVRADRSAATIIGLRGALLGLEDVLTDGRLRPQRVEWSAGPGNVLLFLVRSRTTVRDPSTEQAIEQHLWAFTSTWSDDQFLDAVADICVVGRRAIVGQR